MTASASFAPHVHTDTRLLILGSLPGTASLAARQYYAHPRNQFWRLLGSAIGQELATIPYPKRLKTLAAHRIGLWDVVKSAHRRGSLDSAIRNAENNDLATLIASLPDLRAIAFNGGTAHSIGTRQLMGQLTAQGLPAIRLPSSSPAYAAMAFEAKRDAWLALRDHLE